MRSFRLCLVLSLVISGWGEARSRFPLPVGAQIELGQSGFDRTQAESELCRGFRLTSKQVRARFRSYHQVSESELHDDYSYLPCWFDGTIVVQQRKYTFRANPGNTIETDYPDGKVKTLGGRHTDDPSGGSR